MVYHVLPPQNLLCRQSSHESQHLPLFESELLPQIIFGTKLLPLYLFRCSSKARVSEKQQSCFSVILLRLSQNQRDQKDGRAADEGSWTVVQKKSWIHLFDPFLAQQTPRFDILQHSSPVPEHQYLASFHLVFSTFHGIL